MKYIDINSVVNSYNSFQNCMTNKSWGFLALLKSCDSCINTYIPYELNLDIASNFLEDVFNITEDKKEYTSGNTLFALFSNKWSNFFNDQGKYSSNIYDVAVWAFRRKGFPDDITEEGIIKLFSEEFNIPFTILFSCFDTTKRNISFAPTLYTESSLKNKLGSIGVDITKNNIDAQKKGVVAAPGEISRGPFVQPLYAGIEISDYALILKSRFESLYDIKSIKEIIQDSPKKDLQQIYFGAPGTGKSYAVEQITNNNNSIRTTFHPDSDYSTFVGCYKPMQKVGKQISTKISLEKLKEKATEIINQPAGDKVEQIIDFITLYAERLCEIVDEREDVKSLQNLMNIHFGFSNETYLSKMIMKIIEERKSNTNEFIYAFQPQAFTQAYVKAWQNLSEPFYLVIEEINRGNCAQIFGDIFQLLDRDSATGYSNYKITPDQDLQMYLAKEFANTVIEDEEIKTGTKMQLPGNLHILATMNTSDQSLFPIDSAFKRRWDWKYIPIDYTDLGHYIACGDKLYKWTDFLTEVNQRIEAVTQSEDKKLGAWFVKAVNNEISAEKFVSKVVFYLWNDIYKDFAHDTSTIFKGEFDKFHKFFDFKGDIKLDILEVFLTELGVASNTKEFVPDDEDDDSNTSNARKIRFTLNGEGLSLGAIANKVVDNYAQNHPELNAEQIRTYFVSLCKGIGIAHIVETDAEYQIRRGQSSAERSRTLLTLPNGEIVHVSTQWNAKRPQDNFMRFIDICNNNNLGEIKLIEQ